MLLAQAWREGWQGSRRASRANLWISPLEADVVDAKTIESASVGAPLPEVLEEGHGKTL